MTASSSEFGSYQFKKVLADKGWQYLDGLDTDDYSGYVAGDYYTIIMVV